MREKVIDGWRGRLYRPPPSHERYDEMLLCSRYDSDLLHVTLRRRIGASPLFVRLQAATHSGSEHTGRDMYLNEDNVAHLADSNPKIWSESGGWQLLSLMSACRHVVDVKITGCRILLLRGWLFGRRPGGPDICREGKTYRSLWRLINGSTRISWIMAPSSWMSILLAAEGYRPYSNVW